jgi:copper(I)-binding protein
VTPYEPYDRRPVAVIRTSRRTAGRTRAAVAALVAAGATVLAGCQTGQQAQTAEQLPTIDGNYAQVGSLALRDVTIEYPESGAWEQGSDARVEMIVVNEGREADALVDVRTEVAEGVTLSAAPEAGATATATPTEAATPTASPTGTASPTETASPTGTASPTETASPSPGEPGSPTATATPSPTPTGEAARSIPIPAVRPVPFGEDGAQILLTGLTETLRPAQVVPITFVFQQAGEVTINVAVAIPIEEVSPAPTVPAEGEAEAGG